MIGRIGRCAMFSWLRDALTSSFTGNPSTKRLVAFLAAGVLLLVLIAIGGASAYWIATHGDLGAGAAGALLSVSGPVAILAGAIYRKKEGECSLSPNRGPSANAAGDASAAPVASSGTEGL